MQWLKLPAWKVGNRGFEPHSGLQVSKKQNVSSPLTLKDSILWGASVAKGMCARLQIARARILNHVSGGSAISFTSPFSEGSPVQFSLYVHKGGLNHTQYISFSMITKETLTATFAVIS